MISPRWYKVLRDLWRNKMRTLLVVLSIAVGVFAIGMIQSAQTILSRDIASAYAAVNPASAQLYVLEPLNDDLVEAVRRTPGVKDAERRRSIFVRYFNVKDNQWRNIQLYVIPDFDQIRINKVQSVSGAWPPPDRELLIERASLRLLTAQIGDTLLIEATGAHQRELRIAGLAYDFNSPPPEFQNAAAGYITENTLDWLGAGLAIDQLNFITHNTTDKAEIKRVADLVSDKVERSGRTIQQVLIPEPGKHPIDSIIEPLLLTMGVVGFLALGLSGFLVVNTISAVLAQQVRQIGVMKAVGARTPQVMQLYFGMVVVFGLLSLACAVPSGALGAQAFASVIAGVLNFNLTSLSIPANVLVLQIAVGMIVPLVAASLPIFAGARVTVREAMASYGLGRGRFGMGFTDGLIGRVRGLSRPLMLSLRNTFRRQARLALTLITLVLASAIFITVLSVRDSLLFTFDEALKYFNFDIELIFNRSYRIDQLQREALTVPGVVQADSWGSSTTRRVRPDGTESGSISVIAPNANSRSIQVTMIAGRWLLPDDENAVIVTSDFTRNEADVKVGDDLVLKFKGRDTTWRVVGVARGLLATPIIYINYPYYAQLTGEMGRAPYLLVETERHDPEFLTQVATALEEHFKAIGLKPTGTYKVTELRGALELVFNLMIVVVLMMAVLLAVVGGLGLMGTMSINVLERTREIGVMRAIGASNRDVLQIVLVEGVFIGLMSWLLGCLLAYPLGAVFSDAIGQAIFQSSLNYTFSASGALLWLVIVILLSIIASFLPAWNASRLTVREVLAYE